MTGGRGGGVSRAMVLARRYCDHRWPPQLSTTTSAVSSSTTPLLRQLRRSREAAADEAARGGGAGALAGLRRTFFSVPDFDEMCAKTFSSTKTVQHSAGKLFAVVADVDKYEEFVPFCARSRVVRRHTESHFEAELEIGFRLFNEKYLSDVKLVDGESVTAEAITGGEPGGSRGSGLFERLVSTWKFTPGSHPNECVVNFDIDFRVGSVVHAQAVGLFFEEVSRMQINAFEERCNRLYGIERGHGQARGRDRATTTTTTTTTLQGTMTTGTMTTAAREESPTAWQERRVRAAFEGGGGNNNDDEDEVGDEFVIRQAREEKTGCH